MAKGPARRNPLKKFGIEFEDIDRLPEVNEGVNKFMEQEVVPYWQSVSPTGSGEYRSSIRVVEQSSTRGRGKVAATADHAALVEFGGHNTPEYAPAQKTVTHFGGRTWRRADGGEL